VEAQTGSTDADRRPTNQVSACMNGEVARHARWIHPRSILARMSCVSAKMSPGCYDYEETAPVEFKLYILNVGVP